MYENKFLVGKQTRRCRRPRSFLSAPYLLNQWMDFDQTCTTHYREGKEVIGFDDLDLIFKVTPAL